MTSLLLAAFIILLWGNGQGKTYEQEIGRLESGQMLARWECTVAEYRSFLKSEMVRLRSEVIVYIGFSLGFAGAAAIIFAFLSLTMAWMMGGILLSAGLFVSLITFLQFLNVQARYHATNLETGAVRRMTA